MPTIQIQDKSVKISEQKIDPIQYYLAADHPGSGAIVLFSGNVRDRHHGKAVDHLFYEAYPPMAEKVMLQIITEANQKWPMNFCSVIHRIGKLEIGDTAVVVVTSSPHREEAYIANRFIIDQVKATAPIWKNEIFKDGSSQWGNHCHCG